MTIFRLAHIRAAGDVEAFSSKFLIFHTTQGITIPGGPERSGRIFRRHGANVLQLG